MQSLINVNIVTWNSSYYIRACIEAVLAQAYSNIQITVIDNASTDETLAQIEQFTAASNFRVVRNTDNLGYAAAHNQGIRESSGDYILTLNPDVILTPDFIAVMYAGLTDHPEVGSLSGRLIQTQQTDFSTDLIHRPLETDDTIDSVGLHMSRSRRQKLIGHGEQNPDRYNQTVPIFGPDGACAFYRQSMLADIQIGGEYFDEAFGSHKEDVDLVWRAQLYGWKSLSVPDAIAYHVRSFRPGRRSKISAEVRVDAVKNRWLMLVKNDLILWVLQDLPFIVPYEIGMLAFVLMFEQQSLKGYIKFLRCLPQALRQRRQIQSKRTVSGKYLRQWFVPG